jgi:hypothetical protein
MILTTSVDILEAIRYSAQRIRLEEEDLPRLSAQRCLHVSDCGGMEQLARETASANKHKRVAQMSIRRSPLFAFKECFQRSNSLRE